MKTFKEYLQERAGRVYNSIEIESIIKKIYADYEQNWNKGRSARLVFFRVWGSYEILVEFFEKSRDLHHAIDLIERAQRGNVRLVNALGSLEEDQFRIRSIAYQEPDSRL